MGDFALIAKSKRPPPAKIGDEKHVLEDLMIHTSRVGLDEYRALKATADPRPLDLKGDHPAK
jgi:hypothetical protein